MSISLTQRALNASQSNQLTPNLVLDIEGVTDLYGAVPILTYIRVGDPGLLIGDSWVIGGSFASEDQLPAISFEGSSTTINQTLNIDKASGTSVSQMTIALADIDGQITRLITPGEVVDDILARRATVWLGFGDTTYPDDYIRIFRGIIDEVSSTPGKITFQLSAPDKKKMQDIFIKADSVLDGAINDTDTSLILNSSNNFLFPITGPDGLEDTSIQYGLRIDDEIIFYDSITSNTFNGLERGALNTLAASHADEAEVVSFIRITGNSIDLALKILLSGWNGPYEEDVAAQNFNTLGDLSIVDNAIYFDGIDIADVHGVVIGDYITTTGATNGANNVTLKQISQVVKTDGGSYVVVDDVTFVTENTTSAVVDFRSQYDTFHPGCGLKFHNNEVDIEEHENIRRKFLSSFEYDFYMRETVDGKEFIETEIYFPAAAYSLPRKTRASLGYHVGPLPGDEYKVLDTTTVVNASKLAVKRSISKNLYNTVLYQYEEKVLEADVFAKNEITKNQDSVNRIAAGIKALIIKSKGLREVLSGKVNAQNATARRLRIYKFAAEYIDGLQVTMGSGFNVEMGDLVLLDLGDLQMSDTKNGTRNGNPRYFQVNNKSFDPKTGKIVYSLLDTGYSTDSRYSLMSPGSKLYPTSTATSLKLKVRPNSRFGSNEGGKWSRYLGATVRVRSPDGVTRNALSTIKSVSGNTVTLDTSLGFTPLEDDYLIFANYDEMPNDKVSQKIKARYGFMVPGSGPTFPFDGSMGYQMF